MSNRKTEGSPRSEIFFQSAGYDPFFPIIDEEALRLARLFAEEERLTAQIGNDELTIDNGMVYRAVALARKIAKEGYPIKMVSLDEMLDIAQIFCFKNPHAARIEQELVLEDPQRPRFATRLPSAKFLNYAAELTTGPDSHTASSILVDLLAKLQDGGSPAWTARVAVALAYFSVLQESDV